MYETIALKNFNLKSQVIFPYKIFTFALNE